MKIKSISNWEGTGSSVILGDKAVLVPPVPNSKGLIYTIKPMPWENMRDWTLEFDLEVGGNFFDEWGDGGAVFYYL